VASCLEKPGNCVFYAGLGGCSSVAVLADAEVILEVQGLACNEGKEKSCFMLLNIAMLNCNSKTSGLFMVGVKTLLLCT